MTTGSMTAHAKIQLLPQPTQNAAASGAVRQELIPVATAVVRPDWKIP